MSEPETLDVLLPPERGVVAVGPYLPGTVYRLPAAEANRLLLVKGFVRADTMPVNVTATEET